MKIESEGLAEVSPLLWAARGTKTPMAKASPKPSDFVKLAARNLGLIKTGEEALPALEKVWAGQQLPGKGFRDFEAALMRLGKDYCRKARCEKCPLREECRCRRD